MLDLFSFVVAVIAFGLLFVSFLAQTWWHFFFFFLLFFGVIYDMDIRSGGYILSFVYFFVSFVIFFFYVYNYDSMDHLG